jgi:hypothetical protein
MTANTCRTFLISDLPSAEDEFGSHQRLADAVLDLILSEKEGGKTIGVEGDWGSGKSTVINLINAKLSKEDENLVFLFDAWAHHDDPLRRTFLESLIIQAEQKEWVNIAVWKKRRAVLGQRIKFERKVVNSNLKVWARWFVASTLLLPVGVALLSSGFNSATAVDSLITWKVSFGLLLTLLPAIILMWVLFNSWRKQRLAREPEAEREDPWSFLVQNSMTDTSSQTFQTPNPTSIEFGQTFSDFMEAALLKKERKVIIILDNLDRVEADDALSLLSTLQTFLQHSNTTPGWLARLWIIIPYDRGGLEKLWSIHQNINADTEEEQPISREYNSEIATSFLDKRFQIRFEVPPIVSSDWSAYLKRLLKEAFPDHPEGEFHTVYRVYTLHRPSLHRFPTPRELKLYVNQIGAIHRQWQDAFPLSHVAYYVLLKRRGENVIEGLLAGEYKENQLEAFFGSDLIDNLSALVFNVEIPLARQLLLRDPIESALRDGNDTRFFELKDQPGFSQVLESISFSEWIHEQAPFLVNAASILHTEIKKTAIDADTEHSIVREFRQALRNARTWSPFTPQIGKGLAILFELVDADNRLIRGTFWVISNTRLEIPKDDISKSSEIIESWIDGVIVLLEAVQKTKNLAEIFTDKILIPCPATMYIDGCARLYDADSNAKYWHMFRPFASSQEIVVELSKMIANKDELTNLQVKALNVLKKQELNIAWTPLFTELKNKLQTTNNYDPKYVGNLLEILWELRSDNEFQPILNQLVSQGFILHHLNSSKKEAKAAAYCIFSFLYIFPNARNVTQQGSSDAGRSYMHQIFNSPGSYVEVTEQFVNLLDRHGEYDLPFKMQSTELLKDWVKMLVKNSAAREDPLRFFSVINFMQHWSFIEASLESENFESICEKMVTDTDILRYIANGEFDASQAGLYAALIRCRGSKDDRFANWCINDLKGISQENMQIHINQGDSVAELIIDLVDNDIKFDMGTEFQEIMFNHAVALMKAEVHVDYLAKYWDYLLQPLSSYARDTLRDRLIEEVIQRNGDVSQDFFTIYGDELMNTRGLERNRSLVLHIFTPLIKNRHVSGIKWIVKLLETKPTLLSDYSPKRHVQDLRDWIEQALESNITDEASEALQRIAEVVQKTQRRKRNSKHAREENNAID